MTRNETKRQTKCRTFTKSDKVQFVMTRTEPNDNQFVGLFTKSDKVQFVMTRNRETKQTN
jgi:hypothetical protein